MRNSKILSITIILFTLPVSLYSQSPPAKIADIKWLEGVWISSNDWGISEEYWSTPSDSAIAGLYNLTVKGKQEFYELMTIYQKDNSLALRIKHFSGVMHGWEEKDVTVDFALKKIDKNSFLFDGPTYKKTISYTRFNDNHLKVILNAVTKDGKPEITEFEFSRKP